MSHHLYKTEGLILKKCDCGEADRIITFFSKDFGRVEVLVHCGSDLKAKWRDCLSCLALGRLGKDPNRRVRIFHHPVKG